MNYKMEQGELWELGEETMAIFALAEVQKFAENDFNYNYIYNHSYYNYNYDCNYYCNYSLVDCYTC